MTRRNRILLAVMIFLLLLLVAEFVFRPRSVNGSLANMLYGQGRYESAAKLFDRYNDDAQSAANLGKARYKQGDFAQAESDFNAATGMAPEDADIFYDKGNAAFRKEDYQSAVENYEQTLILNPSDDDARANLELALKKLEENPPPPQEEPKPDEDKKDQEEVRNLLEALDNLEARERKNQRRQSVPRTDNWW